MEFEDDDVSLPEATLSVVSVQGSGAGGRVFCRYTPRHTITLYTVPTPSLEEDDVTTDIHDIEWNGIIWNSPTRKLVNQSHAFFMELQQMGADKGVEPADVLKYSQLYRSALHECVLGLQKMIEEIDSGISEEGDEVTQLRDQIELYSILEIAWHLCEVLFIETLPVGCLIQQLLEWVRWHDDHTDIMLRDVMNSSQPSEEPDYWKTIFSLVLQGRVKEVIEMLKHSPDCQKNRQVHNSINELLRKMPMVKSVVGKSRAELRGEWHEWKHECKRRRERGDFVAYEQLEILSGILCGDEMCFREEEVVESCTTWYEMMVGRLLYCSPLILNTDYDLHFTAENCLQQHCDLERLGSLDRILLTALQNNVIDVIKLSSSVLSNWWFVAHLANILHHRGILVTSQLEYGSKLTEFVLVEYASSLFYHPSLWQVGMDYLSHCPTQGRHYMIAFIERVPLQTEKKAQKVIRVCQQYGLTEQAHSICRVLARRAYGQGQFGNALTWSIRSKDASFAAFLAEKYFDKYQSVGQFQDLAMLDHLGDAMLLSKRLTFLGKYRELQLKYTEGNFTGAGQLLVNLLKSGTVPKKYWSTFLTDALPLLELEDQLIFDVEQTQALMHALHQTQEKLTTEEESTNTITSKKLSLLQLSLVRNLQRAMLETQRT